MTARGTWKAFERQVAKDIGGKRIPVTGVDRHGADVIHPLFHFQTKLGRRFPSYLRDWLDGIRGTARAENKIGVVIWREKGQRTSEALVCLRWDDWCDLHGEGK